MICQLPSQHFKGPKFLIPVCRFQGNIRCVPCTLLLTSLLLQDEVEVRTRSGDADSAVSLKKRHYGRHRSSLLYGGFVDSTVSYSGGAETKAPIQEVEDDKEETEVKLKRYHTYMYGSCLFLRAD